MKKKKNIEWYSVKMKHDFKEYCTGLIVAIFILGTRPGTRLSEFETHSRL